MATERITEDDVRKVASLARLALSPDEVADARAALDAILGHVAELDGLDVTGVQPTFHSIPIGAALRADLPEQCANRHEILSQAPASDAGGFAVQRVLEGDE